MLETKYFVYFMRRLLLPKARLFVVFLVFGCVAAVCAEEKKQDLTDLTLDELINTPVYSASKFDQRSSEAPSSVSVISSNEIERYGYRTLGPTVNGAVVGGRVLATASIEAEHALTARLPALLGALFVDAGNAADRWNEMRPVVGVGAGLHYRSPVGPLRLDLAYGTDERRFRLHLSVGVTF